MASDEPAATTNRQRPEGHRRICPLIVTFALTVLGATAALLWAASEAGVVVVMLPTQNSADYGRALDADASSPPKYQQGDDGTDGTCASFRSSQLHGSISQTRAADIVRRLVSSSSSSSQHDAQSCPTFFRNYYGDGENSLQQQHQAYTSWTPWQPPETLTLWSRNFPCQHPEFCDDLFSLNDTAAIARLLYDHQHPRDCSSANFLVIEREWHSGLGSTVHIKAYSLLIALMSNRVLIDSPDIQWTMTNAASCETQDWSCYFAPLTNCTLPEDWRSKAESFRSVAGQLDAQYVVNGAEMNLADAPGIGGVQLADPSGSFSAFNQKPASWWMTQATGYVARPNKRTLQAVCYIWDCILGAEKQQAPQRPFSAMFIRRGDKWWESKLREPFEYFDLLEGLERNLSEPIRSVYVGTDDPKTLSQVAREYSTNWDLIWMGYHRSSQGSQHHEEVARYHTAKMELQVLLTLAEVFISASADVLVGTLSSNQCRLMDELRKLQGKGRMPYLTPEGELIAGQ